jgi:hypothetical protein
MRLTAIRLAVWQPRRRLAVLACALACLLPHPARCQLSTAQADAMRRQIGSRIEAMTIFGGDFALAGGSYGFSGNGDTRIDVSKFGGAGDVGDPRPLGPSGLAWQPRLQGSMGTVDATSGIPSGPLAGGSSRFKSFAVQFGLGARVWFNDRFSVAPTLTGMYGHTSNEYTQNGPHSPAALASARQLGLAGSSENTWTLRPALNLQYQFTWDRTIVTLSSDPAFFHTESFSTSNAHDIVVGDSASLASEIDLDIPLGRQLFGHELRSGGYFSRTELFDDLKEGLGTQHIYEAHGRLVLDYLHQFWKVQWVGIGGSYLWGSNFTGWTVGADVMMRF